MNTPHRPLSADELDELLSADLDGELDRAATDLGLTPGEARTAIEATPEAATRRTELIAARDLLARGPALTPADEHRLVTAALAGDAAAPASLEQHRAEKRRSERPWRVLAAVGSAAAVIAVIFALGVSNPGSESKSSSADSAGLSEADATTTPGGASVPRAAIGRASGSVEFGDVTKEVVLRARVRSALSAANAYGEVAKSGDSSSTTSLRADGPSVAPSPPGPQGAQSAAGGTGSPGGGQGLIGDDANREDENKVNSPPIDEQFGGRPDAPSYAVTVSPLTEQICVASAARAARVRSAPAVSGSGTYNGQQVVVVVFRQGSGHAVYVMSTPECAVIARRTVA